MESKHHILLIDDDPVIQRLMGAKLSKAGYEVLYANDSPTGREIARRLQPALILLDIRMPNEDGFAVARRLHEEEPTKDIPIIFLTNEDLSREGEQWAKEKWVVDYFHKSIDPDEFIERIQKIVQPKRAGVKEGKLINPK
ncbi:MAG: hypothetical protein COT91_01195 [Candidatus Doudnabacteria bacterium CG10_big_fil_rev_8_21_14_0_10_41_10]|uniref:Response regulatory domain-containing protein n=1 Tax=Candidatus Doudnabacteria bacterium CG10_big_fil_rev_8_21_14_0_10_41_10 TaxID=1974551 RepID=A0A2H0VEG1_9BACT|nr:MAG: hypothetical protein COT91_01195 [Candidatus Doudnabacteria bacterium CG10_big_fil_rev_8_21_14_0_10_41_10]